jgi:hypothetical protein
VIANGIDRTIETITDGDLGQTSLPTTYVSHYLSQHARRAEPARPQPVVA